ncbi:hypothetical protein, partial [Pseudomonas syringae group genomosp. 3]
CVVDVTHDEGVLYWRLYKPRGEETNRHAGCMTRVYLKQAFIYQAWRISNSDADKNKWIVGLLYCSNLSFKLTSSLNVPIA